MKTTQTTPLLTRCIYSGLARAINMRAILATMTTLSLMASAALAQQTHEKPLPVQTTANLRAAGPSTAQPETQKMTAGPSWQELTAAQRVSLKPLATSWNSLEVALKRKWIALAANYPALTPAEQAKLHSRMSEWSQLSKQERAQARLNFAESKKVSPDQKTATWEAYQALAPEEKKKLAASAPPKLTGAAGAAKPVAPQKLATVPLGGQNQSPAVTIQSPQKVIDSNTLLPLPAQVTEPAPKSE